MERRGTEDVELEFAMRMTKTAPANDAAVTTNDQTIAEKHYWLSYLRDHYEYASLLGVWKAICDSHRDVANIDERIIQRIGYTFRRKPELID